jgi:hypothetical protein
MSAAQNQDTGALRAEHDELARRLEIRTSVDHAKKGLIRIFVGLLSTGLAIRLAWDRWGPLKPGHVRRVAGKYPLFLYAAGTVAVVLLVLGIVSLLRARRLGREEDRLFARFRQLRAELGFDR